MERGFSERRACRVLSLGRSTARYIARRAPEVELIEQIRTLADTWRGSGYRRIHSLLRDGGQLINHKRVLRLWRVAGLDRRIKRPRQRVLPQVREPEIAPPERANDRWALDFLSDRLENGDRYRILAVVDVFTRECLCILAARSMPAWRVVQVVDRIAVLRGVPNMITLDNGPELISKALKDWAAANSVVLRYSRPGTPTDNPFIESFNARLRAECGDLWWVESIDGANEVLRSWQQRFNNQRTHSSIGKVTPAKFAKSVDWVGYRTPAPLPQKP